MTTDIVSSALSVLTWKETLRQRILTLQPALVAIAVLIAATEPRLVSLRYIAIVFLLGLAFVLTPRRRVGWLTMAPVLVILASEVVAIVTSQARGDPYWSSNIGWLVWGLTGGAMLYLADERLPAWILPVALVGSGALLLQGFLIPTGRLEAFTANPAVVAGLLVVGIWVGVQRRQPWWIIPFWAALPLTGCRWATGVALVGIAVALFRTRGPTRLAYLGAAAGGILLAVVLYGYPRLWAGYHTPVESPGQTAASVAGDAVWRFHWEPPPSPSFIPYGAVAVDIQHVTQNTPLRMVYEQGYLASIAWVVLTGIALLRRGTSRWLMAPLALLAMVDFSTWAPTQISLLWWAAVGMSRGFKATLP